MAKILSITTNHTRDSQESFVPRSILGGNFDEVEIYLALQSLGHEVYKVDHRDWNGESFTKMYQRNYIDPLPIEDIDLIVFFSLDISTTSISSFFSILDAISRNNILSVNDVKTIRHNCDKRYMLELAKQQINIVPSYLELNDTVLSNLDKGNYFIAKPLISQKGDGIQLVKSRHDLEQLSLENKIIQPLRPEYNEGEFSLIYLNGEYQYGWSRHRTTTSGPYNNVHRGAISHIYSPTPNEIDFGSQVIRAYDKLGYIVRLGRIDFIKTEDGPLLTEAEFLNPLLITRYDLRITPFAFRYANYCHCLITASN